MLDAATAYKWTALIAGTGLLIGSLESLWCLSDFRRNGIFSWTVIRCRLPPRVSNGRWARYLDFAAERVLIILLIRIAAIVGVMVSPPFSAEYHASATVILFTLLAMTWRRIFGDDGSDQMNVIIFATLALCSWPGAPGAVIQLGLGYIAFQACLAYAVSGIAKLVSIEWRCGRAISGIFDTYSYGLKPAAVLVKRYHMLAKSICWTTIALETLFPIGIFLGPKTCLILLALGTVFHLATAVIMGLNSFLWAFCATYPSLLYVTQIGSLGLLP